MGPTDNPAADRDTRSLGDRTAAGFAWLLIQTVGSRFVSLGSQLVLAVLLSEADFGIMAMAVTAMAVTQLVQHIGLTEVLVQRAGKVRLWIRDAQHLALTVGGLASLVMALSAPVVAMIYREPEVAGVVLALAPAPLFRAFATVGQAVLRVRMRFRTVALIDFIETMTIALAAIPLAAAGVGPYALAAPITLAALLKLVLSNRSAGVRLLGRVRPRRWRMLVSSGGKILASRVFIVVLQQADYAVLALFHPAAAVGVYYYAFGLSTQGVRMLTMNVVGVLLPALSTMSGEPDRLRSAYLRSVRSVAVLAIPFGMLQAGLVEPVVQTLFPGKWEGLGPMVQVLSIGMIFSVIGITTSSVLMSQRRYNTVLVLAASQSVLFLAMIVPAAAYAGALEVAIVVGIYHVIVAPVRIWISIRTIGGSVRETAGVFAGPVVSGLAGAGAGIGVGWAIEGGWPLGKWGGALAAVGIGLPVYCGLVLITNRATVNELAGLGLGMARRALRRGSAQ